MQRQVFVFVGKILNSLSKIANLSSCGYIATRSTPYVLQWGCREPKPVADSTVQLWCMQCTYNNPDMGCINQTYKRLVVVVEYKLQCVL